MHMTEAEKRQRFHEVYTENYAKVLGYCLRRIDRDQAQDVASEVFTVAWRRLDGLPGDDATLPWLYGVAARTLANFRRSSKRRANLGHKLRGFPRPAMAAAETQVVRRLEDQSMIDTINRLSETDREILLLSAWEGLPSSQIALRFEISPKAAEKRLTRAKKRLAAHLERAETRSIAVNAPLPQEGGSR